MKFFKSRLTGEMIQFDPPVARDDWEMVWKHYWEKEEKMTFMNALRGALGLAPIRDNQGHEPNTSPWYAPYIQGDDGNRRTSSSRNS